MKVFTGILIVASIAFLALTVHQNVKLTETGLTDNTKFLSIHGDYYSYDEIESVYYRNQTPNDYGDMVDIPSYVIRLKNKQELDFYDFDTCDKTFLSIFQEKNIFVELPHADK